jgi:drug/metabolite transporter (DMT)-like permease
VLSTGFLAGTILWVERPIYAENRSGVVTLLMFALLAAFSSLLYPLLGGTIHAATALFGTPVLCELMVAVVVLCTVLTFLIMNTWQRLISATEAGLIYCIEPVIATALCAFVPGWISRVAGIDYPNESLRWGLFFGGSLIIGAAILAATQKRD